MSVAPRPGSRSRRFPHPTRLLFALLLWLGGPGICAASSPPLPIAEDEGITGFGLALRHLGEAGSVLWITAHPDDEDNALLALLGRGRGYRTGLLTLTRGDGGQNEIGPELFKAIGLLRSGELEAVHRFDGARQYYSRAFEFGYSFSVEETFEKWGREEILADVVRVIREFRPTVILAMNPEGAGGGQHHQASGRLAAEAFRLAGDPTAYPGQLDEGLRPWQPRRLFHSLWVGMGRGRAAGDLAIRCDLYDPLLGESYSEFGARARGNHRSQGMNVLPQPTPHFSSWVLADTTGERTPLEGSFFTGIDTDLDLLAAADDELASSVLLLEGYVSWARDAFDRGDYTSAVKAVMTGLESIRRMQQNTSDPELLFLLEQEERDFMRAAEKGHFIYFDALVRNSDDGLVVAGEPLEVTVRFQGRSPVGVEVEQVRLEAPPGWTVEEAPGTEQTWNFRVTVPAGARLTRPYWHLEEGQGDRYSVREGYRGVEEFTRPPLEAVVEYRSFDVTTSARRVVQHRWFDAAYGSERRRELSVVPRLGLELEPSVNLVRLDAPGPKSFKVNLTHYYPGETRAVLRLEVPAGWKVEPAEVALAFREENEVQSRGFTVTPPAGMRPGDYPVSAVAEAGGESYRLGVQTVSYAHVQPRLLMPEARGRLVAADVRLPAGLRVGYIMGVGDDVGEATEQLGAEVTYLDEAALTSGDLSRFDVIVTGVRAYLARPDLVANNHRLLEYVEGGGHLVVQYNKYEFLRRQFSPYPVTISRPHDRVTVEESPVRILQPGHALFRRPNAIGPDDFSGWVQERGLYFLGEWDARFTPLLELQDPWPYNSGPKQGALVIAGYGRGTYVYTGLAFFRQLPAGVPGAYRLWANLLTLGRR